MILKFVLYCIFVHVTSPVAGVQKCLSGHMTDVQSWVTKDGTLIEQKDKIDSKSIDLSGKDNAVQELQAMMSDLTLPNSLNSDNNTTVVTSLSLSRCGLTTVPQIFNLRDRHGRSLADSLQYLTLFGNRFDQSAEPATFKYEVNFNATGAVEYIPPGRQIVSNRWESGLQSCKFANLLELDLRNCCIKNLKNNIFQSMPSLEALYLSENFIAHIEDFAFRGLSNLVHLDLSNNNFLNPIGTANSIRIDSVNIFSNLSNLGSLDFSNTRLSQSIALIFDNMPESLQRLSICNTGIISLGNTCFAKTNLKYLDVSGNSQILSIEFQKFLENLSRTLVVLYADRSGLQSLNSFKDFHELEILKISNNGISSIPVHVASTWRKLRVLDLTANRIPSWFGPNFKLIPQLAYLSLVRNNLNMISEIMINDLKDIKYIGLSDNYFVCSCHVREFIEAAIKSENRSTNDGLLARESTYESRSAIPTNGNINLLSPLYGHVPPRVESKKETIFHKSIEFHTGYDDYEFSISNRVPPTTACDEHKCLSESHFNTSYLLFDYDNNAYRCYIVNDDVRKEFMEVDSCDASDRNLSYERVIEKQVVVLIVIICVPLFIFIVISVILFRRWWCIKYFCITVKNSAMLSIINNEEKSIGTDGIYHYDVFVSYCNEDRAWVLEQLLPHVETDSNVSVCLHERDFQVGQSILENIVSCMDRSRAILLVISNKFLMSQWCQFEMHLAQHRLLETRREDLILVLLEDIPRMRRPHTLHYLMMTKTYIVWPRSGSERENFWRRVKKSLANKTALREAVSDA